MDVRVEAIRQDTRVGRGTCSTLDECFTDAEVTAWLDEQGVGPRAVTAAVRAARSFEAIRRDVFEDRTAEARREAEAERAEMVIVAAEEAALREAIWKCSWRVEVNAAAYHNQGYDEMVVSLSEEEIEQYGYPEPWYPDSAADSVMEIECGAQVEEVNKHGLCPAHEALMEMDGLEFEQMVDAR